MSRRRILVVEDDAAIRRGLVDACDFAGYAVEAARDGRTAVEMAACRPVDLMILDLNLPELDGMEVLRQVRQSRPTLPVIILSARGAETDRVRGLRIGADDYVVKPFSIVELLARVEAVIRRAPTRPLPADRLRFSFAEIRLDSGEAHLAAGGVETLSVKETALLQYFAENADRIVTRNELLNRVWHVRPEGMTTRSVDMQVARLRERLRSMGAEAELIETVRGRGYRFCHTEGSAS